MSRYIIGLDLGTTNSCVSYVDTDRVKNPTLAIQPFKITQLISGHRLGSESVLPSFCYLAGPSEFSPGSIKLPWGEERLEIVGFLAQQLGALVPTRLVQSAKSWLCHAAANRRDRLLPVESATDIQKISPVEATSYYLRHLKEAWNHAMADQDLEAEWEQQHIILTVPASFDEVARSLTVEAARMAGFVNITLLEEPQAAFYSWISQHEDKWQTLFRPGDRILVCDVGGGTTDFSLIELQETEGQLSFQRMAVGDHLLLGGDNMDAALAHQLEHKLREQGCPELSPKQWRQLHFEARQMKAQLRDDKKPVETYPFYLQGAGSSVVKGGWSIEMTRQEVMKTLCEGFFGLYDWEEANQLRKASGFRSIGLPYEEEPSITKHLAHFLKRHSGDHLKGPDYILFHGGTLKPQVFQDILVQSLERWFGNKKPLVLPSISLDLAVARGAAYYGKVRQGLGVKIGGGTARSYYLQVEHQEKSEQKMALTLLPRGCEEGMSVELDQTFWVKPNTPVSFRLFSSHVRLYDRQMDLIPIQPEELQLLPPILTLLKVGKGTVTESQQDKIPVHLTIHLTAIGTIELGLKSLKTDHRWKMEFQLRAAGGQDFHEKEEKGRRDESWDVQEIEQAARLIEEAYQGKGIDPQKIMGQWETLLQRPRHEWPPSLLRGLWPAVLKQAPRRKISQEHEARWWHLVGFLLRPGFGYPLDDHRIRDLWKIILSDLKGSKSAACAVAQWICFRRIAGGLNKGQQMQLASELVPTLLTGKSNQFEIKGKGAEYAYSEKIRALAAMELLDMPIKIRLGNALIQRIKAGQALASDFWALGRIGARHLAYGSLAYVVPKATCATWIEDWMKSAQLDGEEALFAIGQLARKTDSREVNLSPDILDNILKHFPHSDRLHTLLHEGSPLTHKEQEHLFGDQLPVGISLF